MRVAIFPNGLLVSQRNWSCALIFATGGEAQNKTYQQHTINTIILITKNISRCT